MCAYKMSDKQHSKRHSKHHNTAFDSMKNHTNIIKQNTTAKSQIIIIQDCAIVSTFTSTKLACNLFTTDAK